MTGLGPLGPLDELLAHQIVDTFATVSQSDRSWTEKICAMAAVDDGSISLGFGLGKYPNRGVMDAYAGVSRGIEQWTVRASRELGADGDTAAVGPMRYEVLEPMRHIRFALAANDAQPVSFEWVFEGVVPSVLGRTTRCIAPAHGRRIDADIARYHQIGTAHGWVDVAGDRGRVRRRDMGLDPRPFVGRPVPGRRPDHGCGPRSGSDERRHDGDLVTGLDVRADGTHYGLHTYYQRHAFGDWQRIELQGGFEHADGRCEPYAALRPAARRRSGNRRVLGGVLHATMSDGTVRDLTLTAVSATGFHLGAGLYFGFDGQLARQMARRVSTSTASTSQIATTYEEARRLHQLRDCIVRVEDPVGGGVGVGNFQSIVAGPHPDLGLDEQSSFM